MARKPARAATRASASNGRRPNDDVTDIVARLSAAMESDYVVLGGGNAKKLDELPPNARLGGNEAAFAGGFRLWDPEAPAQIVA